MDRRQEKARWRWSSIVEKQGLTYHTLDAEGDVPARPYWDESASYTLAMSEVEHLEKVAAELSRLCLLAVENVIEKKRYEELAVPAEAVALIERSWNEEAPSIYGRFDLSWDKDVKLLEYNADTPTALLEAAGIQWHWLEDRHQGCDQWNSIHERLVKKWTDLRGYLRPGPLAFLHMDVPEDLMTVTYLANTALEAGIDVVVQDISALGWETRLRHFVDGRGRRVENFFKLYPWEWIFRDEFARNIDLGTQHWIEPAWKMLLSNKGILAILWELFPGHPNLVEAHIGGPKEMKDYVRKPLLGREGANVTICAGAERLVETGGGYGAEGHVYQAFAPLPSFDGKHPVMGVWMIDHEPAGLGIREDDQLITTNRSRFVPHVIIDAST